MVSDCSMFTRLQSLADALVDKFVSKGLMKREYDRVKLHATVMNTKQRESPEEQTSAKKNRSDVPPRFKKRISFDATKLITVSHLNFHGMSSIHYMYSIFLYRYEIFVPLAKSDTGWKPRNQSLKETLRNERNVRWSQYLEVATFVIAKTVHGVFFGFSPWVFHDKYFS